LKLDFQTSLAIVGISLTVFFGVWSIVKGKVKASSRFVKLFLVLLVLYTGQFFSAKFLGQPLLPPIAFYSSVTLMLVWLMIATFRDNE
jgi:hypothetical protein